MLCLILEIRICTKNGRVQQIFEHRIIFDVLYAIFEKIRIRSENDYGTFVQPCALHVLIQLFELCAFILTSTRM